MSETFYLTDTSVSVTVKNRRGEGFNTEGEGMSPLKIAHERRQRDMDMRTIIATQKVAYRDKGAGIDTVVTAYLVNRSVTEPESYVKSAYCRQ